MANKVGISEWKDDEWRKDQNNIMSQLSIAEWTAKYPRKNVPPTHRMYTDDRFVDVAKSNAA